MYLYQSHCKIIKSQIYLFQFNFMAEKRNVHQLNPSFPSCKYTGASIWNKENPRKSGEKTTNSLIILLSCL